MIDRIFITEVGLRDGLQNEQVFVETQEKISVIESLIEAGCCDLEVTAFVHQKRVPQMRDAEALVENLPANEKVIYSALVPNMHGWLRVNSKRISKVGVLLSTTESFCNSNLGCSITESKVHAQKVVEQIKEKGIRSRAYISCAVTCPYEGVVDPKLVRNLVDWCIDLGIDEFDIGDTVGMASVKDIDFLVAAISDSVDLDRIIWHGHDTYGRALLCASRALQHGISRFDASVGGFGGCPFAPGAAGNLATEDLVSFANHEGLITGVDLDGIFEAIEKLEKALGKKSSSKVSKTRFC